MAAKGIVLEVGLVTTFMTAEEIRTVLARDTFSADLNCGLLRHVAGEVMMSWLKGLFGHREATPVVAKAVTTAEIASDLKKLLGWALISKAPLSLDRIVRVSWR